MNAIRTLTAAALLLASSAALASEPATELRWDCSRKGAPSYHQIATTFGFDNYEMAQAAQPSLYRQLRRECQRGAKSVLLVLEPRRTIEVKAVASR